MRVGRSLKIAGGAILSVSGIAGLLGYPSDAPTWYRCIKYGRAACPDSLASLSAMSVDPTKVWNIAFLLMGLALFIPGSWWRLIGSRRFRSLVDPKAKIVFDSRDDNHVQFGLVDIEGTSAGSKSSCDEYIYALGIVSVSAKPVSGCCLILEKSTPHDTSEQRLGRPMRVRGDPDAESAGNFTLNPGDGQHPGVYVEVLQEIVQHQGQPRVPAKIRLKYANTLRAHENWFTNLGEHTLTFRLEGDFAKPIRYRLSVRYDEKRRRWRVEQSEGRDT
jgi:hypothetical protein